MAKTKTKKELYVFFGPQGSGKTVQANYLARQLKLKHISWGFICRDVVYHQKYKNLLDLIYNNKTPIQKKSVAIASIIENEIMALGSHTGLVLDGFPRQIQEAELLIKIAQKFEYEIKAIIYINPSFETAYLRCNKRLVCSKCAKYYDDLIIPKVTRSCDDDGGRLVRFKVSKASLKKDFFSYSKEVRIIMEYLKKYTRVSFSVSGDDDEIVIFSNILLKLRNGVGENYHLYERKTQSQIETKYGKFNLLSYQSRVDYSFHLVLAKGDVKDAEKVLIRVHSSCITGDIFSSSKCDCGEQLASAMKEINNTGKGAVIYLFQEGRGINIINKIDAYKLQRTGLDTVEANEILGFPAEMRDYSPVRDILNDLGVKSIVLLTNNPDKINKLTDLGIIIHGTKPIEIKPNAHNKKYLQTKKKKMKHRLTKYN